MYRQTKLRFLLLFVLLAISACKEQIIHNLSEREANRLLTHLHEADIAPEKVKQPDGQWAIAVSKGKALSAIKFLNDSRLFRETYPSAAKSSSVLSSRENQRFGYERALSSEIEATLSSMQGVLEARVHLNLPVVDPLFGKIVSEKSNISGSVLIITGSNLNLNEEAIAKLVSGAAGIPAKNITVVISSANGKAEEEEKNNPDTLTAKEDSIANSSAIKKATSEISMIEAYKEKGAKQKSAATAQFNNYQTLLLYLLAIIMILAGIILVRRYLNQRNLYAEVNLT